MVLDGLRKMGRRKQGAGSSGVAGRDYIIVERGHGVAWEEKGSKVGRRFGRKSREVVVEFRTLPKLKRVRGEDKRNVILSYKIKQCCYMFNFPIDGMERTMQKSSRRKEKAAREARKGKEQQQVEDESEVAARDAKRNILLELGKFIVRSNMRPAIDDAVLEQMIAMLAINLFEALPVALRPRPFEKKKGVFIINVEDPAWEHRVLAFSLLCRLLECCGDENDPTDPFRQQFVRRVRKHITHEFVGQMVNRLRSQDQRERKHLEELLLVIYTHFPSLRGAFLSICSNVVLDIVSDTEKHIGNYAGTQLASLLMIVSHITASFGGMSMSPKQNKAFFLKTLVPLCRLPIDCIARYHETWFSIIEVFIQNEPKLAAPLVRVMLRVWPRQDSSKQALFLFHLHSIFSCLIKSEPLPGSLHPSLGAMMHMAPSQVSFVKRICMCVLDEHSDVSSDAVYLLNSDAVFDFIRRPGTDGVTQLLPLVYPCLSTVALEHGSDCVRDTVREMLAVLQQDNVELYAECVATATRKDKAHMTPWVEPQTLRRPSAAPQTPLPLPRRSSPYVGRASPRTSNSLVDPAAFSMSPVMSPMRCLSPRPRNQPQPDDDDDELEIQPVASTEIRRRRLNQLLASRGSPAVIAPDPPERGIHSHDVMDESPHRDLPKVAITQVDERDLMTLQVRDAQMARAHSLLQKQQQAAAAMASLDFGNGRSHTSPKKGGHSAAAEVDRWSAAAEAAVAALERDNGNAGAQKLTIAVNSGVVASRGSRTSSNSGRHSRSSSNSHREGSQRSGSHSSRSSSGGSPADIDVDSYFRKMEIAPRDSGRSGSAGSDVRRSDHLGMLPAHSGYRPSSKPQRALVGRRGANQQQGVNGGYVVKRATGLPDDLTLLQSRPSAEPCEPEWSSDSEQEEDRTPLSMHW